MILVIDNYDSFTYNLVQYLGELGAELAVYRNDKITLDQIDDLSPDGVVISPGPGIPDEAGITVPLIRHLGKRIPILGVCLGHQGIGVAYGGRVVGAPTLMHGKTSLIHHDGSSLFRGLDNPFQATRYHSLVVDRETLPVSLIITARTRDDVIMGLRHAEYPVEGVQFHPESILTPQGKTLLANFLERTKGKDKRSR